MGMRTGRRSGDQGGVWGEQDAAAWGGGAQDATEPRGVGGGLSGQRPGRAEQAGEGRPGKALATSVGRGEASTPKGRGNTTETWAAPHVFPWPVSSPVRREGQ